MYYILRMITICTRYVPLMYLYEKRSFVMGHHRDNMRYEEKGGVKGNSIPTFTTTVEYTTIPIGRTVEKGTLDARERDVPDQYQQPTEVRSKNQKGGQDSWPSLRQRLYEAMRMCAYLRMRMLPRW